MILDTKNIFKKEAKCEAIKKRYGKDISMSVYYDYDGDKFDSMDRLIFYTLDITSKNKVNYKLTEHLKDGATDYVTLEYPRNGEIKKNKFSRFVDAELTMIDKIAEE